MSAHSIVVSTRDAAFAVDERGLLLAWNDAAEGLLGHRSSRVVDRPCWEVLAGRDVFGNDYCSVGCPLLGMARRRRAVSRCELCLRGHGGRYTHVGVSSMVVEEDGSRGVALVHLLTPIAADASCDEPFPWRLCASDVGVRLTARQSQVLAMLALGKGTTEIAELLFIAPATVRNHVKNILTKLKVHSRLEAVSLARRVGLLEGAVDGR